MCVRVPSFLSRLEAAQEIDLGAIGLLVGFYRLHEHTHAEHDG
jgi:hypothetical protein